MFFKRLRKGLETCVDLLRSGPDTWREAPEEGVLFFSADANKPDLVDGLAIDRVMDPLRLSFSDSGYATEEIAYPGSRLVGPKTRNNVKSLNRGAGLSDLKGAIGRIHLLSAEIRQELFITQRASFYRRVLEYLKPRLVFVLNTEPSLSRAAALTKTPLVEVLHARGYSVPYFSPDSRLIDLPDGILCYDEVSSRAFNSVLPTMEVENFRLEFEVALAEQSLSSSPPPPGLFLSDPSKRILFTSSYSPEHPDWDGGLPETLLKQIEKNPDSFLLLRVHPVMRLVPKYSKGLESLRRRIQGLPNVDITWASEAPIYLVLRYVAAHLTWNSSSAYEAADLGVSTATLKPGLRESGYWSDLFKMGLVREIQATDNFLEFSNTAGICRPTRSNKKQLNPEDVLDFALNSALKRWQKLEDSQAIKSLG